MILTISAALLILGFVMFMLVVAYGQGYRHGFTAGVDRCIGEAAERDDWARKTKDCGRLEYEQYGEGGAS